MQKKTALYTRLSKQNADFINQFSKRAGLSKTAFLDKHFDFVRNNISKLKAPHFEKAGNKVQSQGR